MTKDNLTEEINNGRENYTATFDGCFLEKGKTYIRLLYIRDSEGKLIRTRHIVDVSTAENVDLVLSKGDKDKYKAVEGLQRGYMVSFDTVIELKPEDPHGFDFTNIRFVKIADVR
jgi:hypothetical protein